MVEMLQSFISLYFFHIILLIIEREVLKSSSMIVDLSVFSISLLVDCKRLDYMYILNTHPLGFGVDIY